MNSQCANGGQASTGRSWKGRKRFALSLRELGRCFTSPRRALLCADQNVNSPINLGTPEIYRWRRKDRARDEQSPLKHCIWLSGG